MITIITDEKQIQDLHKEFHKKLDRFLREQINCWVGFPGGNFQDTVRYSSDLDIWISVQELDTRFWNGFGLGRPVEGSNNSLAGEINFPYEDINRKIAGAFGVEDNGNILVLHRGRIGGGKKGIGKTYFTDNFRGDFITAIDGDRETEFCLVGELNSKHFPRQVANFINEIYRVKNLDDGETAADFSDLSDFVYTDEHSGQSVTERNDPVIRERTHGIVVNALAQELRDRNIKIGNDRNRDLFIHNRGQIITLFEIKTNSSTQSLYSAVGQLLLYSIPIGSEVKLIAVLPDKLSKSVSRKFHSLGIDILYYEWNNDEPTFINLDEQL
jgi:hypothetical protein